MKIKKNGKVISLTESDIKKLSKTLLKEEDKLNVETRLDELEKKVEGILKELQSK